VRRIVYISFLISILAVPLLLDSISNWENENSWHELVEKNNEEIEDNEEDFFFYKDSLTSFFQRKNELFVFGEKIIITSFQEKITPPPEV